MTRSHNGPERRKARRTWAFTQIGVMVAAIALVAIATDRVHYQTQRDLETISVQTCESVNAGRRSHNRQARLTRQFLMTGAEARRTDASVARSPEERQSDLTAAATFEVLADSYREIELADCRYPPIRDPE